MRGFALTELLIVFAITAIIAGISITAFSAYNRSQVFGRAVTEVTELLSVARSRALSQVKPGSCAASPLDGYEVTFTVTGSEYKLRSVCGGTSYEAAKKLLPSQITFQAGSSPSILFDVSTGTVNNPGAITVSGFGKTSTISVNKIGKITVN